MQVFVQDKLIDRMLQADKALAAPLPLRLLGRFAPLQRIPARLVGIGVRPEHVHTPDSLSPQVLGVMFPRDGS